MNIVYNASAGTGKTYQVTRLYEQLVLQDGIDPREILLMTFTENAAAELRARVAQRLLKARHNAEKAGHDEQVEQAIHAASRLSSAPIGTIHSYCTSLLREHALEAGLSPGFTVFVGDERDELLQQICLDELLLRLESDNDFRAFCAGAHLIGSGNGFGASITETVPQLIAQAGSLGIPLDCAEALLSDPLPAVTPGEFSAILMRLKAAAKPSNKVIEAINALDECIAEADSAIEIADLFDQRFSGHFSYGDARTVYPDFKALKEEARNRERYRERFPAARAFARYVQSVYSIFQQRKHAMNAVDFDDQLRLAAQLLNDGKIRPGFRYVIIDEVQDTSRIQCDIIQSLWNDTSNLVICGDKKQSIYTWRGADPRVMPDLMRLIEAREDNQVIPLQTSYRSKKPILDVVNKLFAAIYDPEHYSDEDNLLPNPEFATDDEKPCIEFLEPDADADLSKQDKVYAEMEAVAKRIRLLVEGPSKWQPRYRHRSGFEPAGKDNAYRYSDILILLRRTTHQSALEQALRHEAVPYTLGGKGRGLFTRQEARDVSLFLNVLTDPKDAYSLIGFLRSPWVGLSDADIAELAWSDHGFSADHLMARHGDKTDVINRYRKASGTRLASELVRMLVEETGYDALLAGLPRGTQRLANLRKVIDWLRETERGPLTTPAAVARKLAAQIAHPPQIPEAALLDPAQNAVTIMTVHGAKGLTKRVVFVPDMSFSDNAGRGFAQVYYNEQHEPALGLRITSPDRTSVKSPGYESANARAADTRKHESNNLFYVAMTRARDLVVTSASAGKKAAGWLALTEPLIGSDIPAISYSSLARETGAPALSDIRPVTARQLTASLSTQPPSPAQPSLRRIPATRLAGEADVPAPDYDLTRDPALSTRPAASAMGSLGHAVLEQLALNDWQGSIEEWLTILHPEFDIAKKDALSMSERIGRTRQLMIEQTRDLSDVRPEFPFVLLDGNNLIDGTIDLLCRTADGFSLFDYKFTDAAEDEILEHYRKQVEIYHRAAQKCYPDASKGTATLIAISHKEVKCIPVLF
jgi:ATP-dependent helicase/nuclease subunit A